MANPPHTPISVDSSVGPIELLDALAVVNRYLDHGGIELRIVAKAVRSLAVEQNAVPSDPAQWLDLAEAKRLSGRSRDTLQLWHTDGKIFARKQAGRWEYDRRSLQKHLAGSK